MSFFRRFVCLFSSVSARQNADAGATVPIIPGQEDSARRRQLSYRDQGNPLGVERVPQPAITKSRSLDATGDPQLRERRRKEKKVAKSIEQTASGKFSIMSLSWMSQWSAFLRGGVLPGPIDLSALKDRKGALKKRALMGVDYTLVTKELAEYLASVYGGDTPITAEAQVTILSPDCDTPRVVPPVLPPSVRPKPSEPKISPWSDEPPLELSQGEATPERSCTPDLSSSTRPTIDRSTTVTSNSTTIRQQRSLTNTPSDLDGSLKADKGLVGLENTGLYCYLNSSLQCLLSLPRVKDWAVKETEPKRKYCFGVGQVARGVFDGGEMTVASAMGLAETVGRKFAPNKMHDAVEFVVYLLEHIDRELMKRHRTKSVGDSWTLFQASHSQFLLDSFAGVLKSDVNCSSCGHSSATFDPFIQLDLPLAKSVSHSLDDFITREPLSPAFVCPGCSRVQGCTRKITLQRCPNSLIITLKRFQSRPQPEKLNQFVTFHKKLELGKYTDGVNAGYQLQSVLVHSGDIEAGHYVAYCKRGHSWYMFNDNLVQSVKLKEVLMQQAYVLFYSLDIPI